jgi:hypothetical protein
VGQDAPVTPGPPSATTRVYLPCTPAALARAVASGRLEALTGHAVTPALREWYAEGDLEELELAALTDAAQAGLALIAAERDATPDGDPVGPPRRVVLAAEAAVVPVPAGAQEGSVSVGERPTGRSAVRLGSPLPWSAVVSVHADEAEAVADVAAAVLALPGAARGEEEALQAVEDAEALDLLWYDATEAPALVQELAGPDGG